MADAKAVITQAASKYGIDPKILWGLYGTETSFGKNTSTSSAGAVGPFQFEPGTAKSLGVNPNDFKSAAFGAARYLAQYKSRGVGGMLSAYNAGPAGGYQAGYVNTTLQNAKSFGGGPVPISSGGTRAGAVGQVSLPSVSRETVETPNPKAKGLQELASLIRSEKGSSENPLLRSGVLTKAAEPTLSTRVTTQSGPQGLPGSPQSPGAVPREASLPQAPPNLSRPAVAPVQAQLPGYITGKGFPAVEKAKGALERSEHHPVNVKELEKAVTSSEHIPTPHGTVHKTPAGPIFVPKKVMGSVQAGGR